MIVGADHWVWVTQGLTVGLLNYLRGVRGHQITGAPGIRVFRVIVLRSLESIHALLVFKTKLLLLGVAIVRAGKVHT